jgi:hypothetical protein
MEAAHSEKFRALIAQRGAQARRKPRTYDARRVAEGTLIYWLKRAAQELREDHERKQVHIAAAMDADQSTIWRFEHDPGWPKNPDLTVAAYAEDLDITPIELWERALALWRKSGEVDGVAEIQARATVGESKPSEAERPRPAEAAEESEAAVAEAERKHRRSA